MALGQPQNGARVGTGSTQGHTRIAPAVLQAIAWHGLARQWPGAVLVLSSLRTIVSGPGATN